MHSSSSLSSVQKACRILSALSNPGVHRLSGIVINTGLDKATVLRLLNALITEGYVARDSRDGGYALGHEAIVIAQASSSKRSFVDDMHDGVVQMAVESGDTACLCIPSGLNSVCVDRAEGPFPFRPGFLQIGRRLPLGVGSAGLALLAWLPEREMERVLEENQVAYARFPNITVASIRKDAAAARRRGYALSANIVTEGTGGIAVPILNREGSPMAALGLTALWSRLANRHPLLGTRLMKEAERIMSGNLDRQDGALCSTATSLEVVRETA
jgi:DNA-binding IclR family transcriptional regulator